ncbi:oxidoreductase [Streptomyces sp. ventii]|uniref:Oxidoreductase n=1 Tax=Streptomyces spiramenti TaxID=2720606 RepID=A0ABX1AMG4_9ACTN|nr:oxidoreductase [Streptomyces spiramenti]
MLPLADLPGVAEAVAGMRVAVDRVYGHRVMRRRSAEVSSEAALRGARASAALAGADWALEEVRRRGDFSADPEARVMGAALRVSAEAGQLLDIWRASPMRVLARLHLVAAGGAPLRPGAGADGRSHSSGPPAVGRPRLDGESVVDAEVPVLPPPPVDEMAARLEALSQLVVAGSGAPALVTAAVVHGELMSLRPFTSHNGVVARAAERIVLVGGGLDPKGVAPCEVGHAELGGAAYCEALGDYASGTATGMARWIAHCGRAAELGARESVAVCEALQRGAA